MWFGSVSRDSRLKTWGVPVFHCEGPRKVWGMAYWEFISPQLLNNGNGKQKKQKRSYLVLQWLSQQCWGKQLQRMECQQKARGPRSWLGAASRRRLPRGPVGCLHLTGTCITARHHNLIVPLLTGLRGRWHEPIYRWGAEGQREVTSKVRWLKMLTIIWNIIIIYIIIINVT